MKECLHSLYGCYHLDLELHCKELTVRALLNLCIGFHAVSLLLNMTTCLESLQSQERKIMHAYKERLARTNAHRGSYQAVVSWWFTGA